jgi:hypothetical protein
MNPITPAPAATLDGSLIGKEILLGDAWWEVTSVTHDRGEVNIIATQPGNRHSYYTFEPSAIVRYRSRQILPWKDILYQAHENTKGGFA